MLLSPFFYRVIRLEDTWRKFKKTRVLFFPPNPTKLKMQKNVKTKYLGWNNPSVRFPRNKGWFNCSQKKVPSCATLLPRSLKKKEEVYPSHRKIQEISQKGARDEITRSGAMMKIRVQPSRRRRLGSPRLNARLIVYRRTSDSSFEWEIIYPSNFEKSYSTVYAFVKFILVRFFIKRSGSRLQKQPFEKFDFYFRASRCDEGSRREINEFFYTMDISNAAAGSNSIARDPPGTWKKFWRRKKCPVDGIFAWAQVLDFPFLGPSTRKSKIRIKWESCQKLFSPVSAVFFPIRRQSKSYRQHRVGD